MLLFIIVIVKTVGSFHMLKRININYSLVAGNGQKKKLLTSLRPCRRVEGSVRNV